MADPSTLDVSSIGALFHGRLRECRPAARGTLNICFLADLDGHAVVLKTHLAPDGRESLRREAALAQAAYGGSLVIDYRDAPDPAIGARGWLIMPALRPLGGDMEPEVVRRMAQMFGRRQWLATPDKDDDLALRVREGRVGLQHLHHSGLVDATLSARAARHLAFLEERLDEFPKVVCHGDLGPKNILSGQDGPVAIDWEDAFWGPEGYDFLYWLTFIGNRRHCHRGNLGSSPLGSDAEISVLTLIVVLKSYLSVISGEHINNRISISSRLADIMEV
ncbi:aminoglycoside phosphotransferase family protein [Azospirillum sp. B4]|uniref:aminoglycoside phosphotransferase family protein n=1 Tax=Azospirillum sp. B4 TaxID=95605 RepID=UPI00131F205F|nr:aminoglycoside phosphotransferase family protein [Azospirillum sp. B4]